MSRRQLSPAPRVRVDYVAERLCLDRSTVSRMAAMGLIPTAAQLSKIWTFQRDKIDQFACWRIGPHVPGSESERYATGALRRSDLADNPADSGARSRVYVVGYGPYVKIGMSETVRGARIQGLQTGAPEKLTIYAHLKGGRALERALHERFAAYRLNGEWFRKKRRLTQWIDAGCGIELVRRRDGERYVLRMQPKEAVE